jgi:hypothetical protein
MKQQRRLPLHLLGLILLAGALTTGCDRALVAPTTLHAPNVINRLTVAPPDGTRVTWRDTVHVALEVSYDAPLPTLLEARCQWCQVVGFPRDVSCSTTYASRPLKVVGVGTARFDLACPAGTSVTVSDTTLMPGGEKTNSSLMASYPIDYSTCCAEPAASSR